MKKWTLSGFDQLSEGTLGNGGQNLYVSKKGGLQRIWRFDVNNDGYVDLLIANSHDFSEHPDLFIISDPTGEGSCQRVLTQGSQGAQVADLNGDGYDDLVIASNNDGHHSDLPSYVYFGGKDGITENRKVDLSAPGCSCVAVGDFDGDGVKEICYQIADAPPSTFSPELLFNQRLRVYKQTPMGFAMADYKDYNIPVSWFCAADIDGDGCDDLYCRTADGKWLVLWGGKDGFSMENCMEVAPATNDKERFEILPYGGGNVLYFEFTRPKQITFRGEKYLFYADDKQVRLIHFEGRNPSGKDIIFPVGNVISAAVGHIAGKDSEDLVLLQVNGLEDQHVLVFFEENGYEIPAKTMPVYTPRDVLLCDFTGNGCDDIVVIQGRTYTAFTSESLVWPVENGIIADQPKRYETHNCIEVYAADFDGSGKKKLVFVNQQESSAYGHIPVHVYLGGKDGFDPKNRLELPGHSAGSMLPIDFNDDGYPDILVMQNGEDQPQLNPPADLYWGSADGFSLENMTQISTPLAWGGHCADLNKDGFLDIIATGGRKVRIAYGSAEGWKDEDIRELDVLFGAPQGTPGGALWGAVADLNGDGWLDLIIPVSWQPYSLIYWGGPEGYSNDRTTKLPIEMALTVRVADLNKDGYPDLVFGSRASLHRNVYHEGSVTIFWGSEQGYSGYNCCVLPSYQSNNITIQDLSGDGWLDIFASSYFNKKERDINSFIYWNDHGSFSLTNRKRLFAHSSSAAWACDFNEDGYVDICLSHHRAYGSHRTDSAIWWNGPEGFKEENRSWLPTIGPHDMVPNDVGDIMNRSPEETYITPVMTAEGVSCVGWEGSVPVKTWVNCQIRTAGSPEELENKPFVGIDGTEGSRIACGEAIPAELLAGACMQVKLFIGAVNSGNSPRITEIYAK